MMKSIVGALLFVAVHAWCVVVTGAQVAGDAGTERSATLYIDPVNGLSVEQAIAMGLQGEHGLLAAQSDVDVARGLREQARLRPNPMASIQRQEQLSGPDHLTTAEFELPLDLFRRAPRIATAERALEVAGYSVADRQRLLASAIRTAYGELAAAARDLNVSDDLMTSTRGSYELLRARVELGAAAALERNRVEVELRRLDAQRLLQAGKADAALIELKRLLGLGPREPLTVRDTLDTLVEAVIAVTAPAAAAAVAARPDVREAAARVRLADARVDQARSEGRFDVSLVGSYMLMDFSFPQMAFGPTGALEPIQGTFHNLTAGAKVTMPLRNRNEGTIAAARAERTGAEHTRRARELSAEAEVASALARDERARLALAVYTSGVRTLSRQNLDVVRQAYELGRGSLSDVLAEQRRYLEVEMTFTDTLRAAFEARTALTQALGEVR
ncbi:MAG: TolC family protein [Acidobacteriota bacterium]